MAKFLKIFGSLFLVLIVTYLGAHFWIRWKNTVDNDVTKISSLVECDPNDVRAIFISQLSGGQREELSFSRIDQPAAGTPSSTAYAQADWRFLKPAKGEADATLIRRIASTVCELYDPILLRGDANPEEAADVSGPRTVSMLEVTFQNKSGERKVTIEFGAPRPDRLVTVIVNDGAGKLTKARIPLQLLQAASFPPEQYQSLQVMRTDSDNIQTATLRIDGKERFTLERLGSEWTLLEGGKDKGPASPEGSRFVNRLTSLKAVGVLDTEYGADRCRIGTAKAVLDIRGVAGREESVRFDYGRGGDVSACSTGRTMKFRVHRDLLKYLDVPAKSLAAK